MIFPSVRITRTWATLGQSTSTPGHPSMSRNFKEAGRPHKGMHRRWGHFLMSSDTRQGNRLRKSRGNSRRLWQFMSVNLLRDLVHSSSPVTGTDWMKGEQRAKFWREARWPQTNCLLASNPTSSTWRSCSGSGEEEEGEDELAGGVLEDDEEG